jgi:5'-nucleotidase
VRLLVTNDDGISSVFLHELVRALVGAGHGVSVVAPKFEQSWIGAAKSRNRAVRSEAADWGFGCPTWAVDGTPSDCVNIAMEHLLDAPPEAVVSGINVGQNASLAFILGSGTVGGACEGALHGLPGIAFSQFLESDVFEALKAEDGVPSAELHALVVRSARHAAAMTGPLAASTPPGCHIVHNVNFPWGCTPDSEVRRTVPAKVLLSGLFSARDAEGAHRLVFKAGVDRSPASPMTDRAALQAGFISHSVLDFSKLGSI